MANGAIDTNQIATLVVDDGIDRDGGLSGLAVTDDQLALTTADGNHAIDRLESGGHRLTHGLALNHARSKAFQRNEFCGRNRAFVVDWLTERVHHAPDHCVADRHAHDSTSALDLVAFADFRVLAEQHHANLVFLQVHSDAGHVMREREQLARHDLLQAMHARDTVAEGDNCADFIDSDFRFVVLNLLPDQL